MCLFMHKVRNSQFYNSEIVTVLLLSFMEHNRAISDFFDTFLSEFDEKNTHKLHRQNANWLKNWNYFYRLKINYHHRCGHTSRIETDVNMTRCVNWSQSIHNPQFNIKELLNFLVCWEISFYFAESTKIGLKLMDSACFCY